MSLLTLIQKTCRRMGIPRPSAVISSTDPQVLQLWELANEGGYALAKRGDWDALVQEWTFITNAAEIQSNTPLPTDLKALLPDTFYNRTTQRKLIGPVSPQVWQALKARPAAAQVYLAFRQREGDFLINPIPTAGETIAYEYRSSYWARSSAGVAKVELTADEDTSALDEELHILDLRWRWRKAKGLDYGEDMATFERAVALAVGEDGGAEALNIGGGDWRWTTDRPPNIPEGGFGL